MVGKVVKLIVGVGFLEFLGGKEEGEGGVEVVLLLEMEEEMEGRMVEVLVVKEVERWPAKREARWLRLMAVVGLCLLEKEEGKKIMKEREDGSVYIYKGVDYYNNALANPSKRDLRLFLKWLRLLHEIRVWQLKLDAGINAASKKKNARSR